MSIQAMSWHNPCWGQCRDVARIGCNLTLIAYLLFKNAHGLIYTIIVILVAAVAAVDAVATTIVVIVAAAIASAFVVIVIVVILSPPPSLSLLSSLNGRSGGAMNNIRLFGIMTNNNIGNGCSTAIATRKLA
jgi:hypothetical protein